MGEMLRSQSAAAAEEGAAGGCCCAENAPKDSCVGVRWQVLVQSQVVDIVVS